MSSWLKRAEQLLESVDELAAKKLDEPKPAVVPLTVDDDSYAVDTSFEASAPPEQRLAVSRPSTHSQTRVDVCCV